MDKPFAPEMLPAEVQLRPVQNRVTLSTEDFWGTKLDTFRRVTLPGTFDRLIADGALTNFMHLRDGGGEHRSNPWTDGLFCETITAASDFLQQSPDPSLDQRLDGYIAIIAAAQEAGGGYLSTYTQLVRPNQRWGEAGGNILWQHDLYNHGCLIEAGVHHYRATGKVSLLRCAVRAANYLCDTIGEPPKRFVVPGHSIAEGAILELYQLVRREAGLADKLGIPVSPADYWTLASFWIHGRGRHQSRINHPQYMGEYAQDHATIHEQYQAVGHAVRATLYYTGITGLAAIEEDQTLWNDAVRLWRNVTERKLAISGGIGAIHYEEQFGADWQLPNNAYNESCASVGLAFWACAMHAASGDGRFYDVIERVLYNNGLSAISLSGDRYFYTNPLESNGDVHRWHWHGCPCCPPMLLKLFARLPEMVCSVDNDTCYVNLYTSAVVAVELPSGQLAFDMQSDYPWQGVVSISITQAPHSHGQRLAVRIPEWAAKAEVFVNNERQDEGRENGYLMLGNLKAGDRIRLELPMEPRRVQAHPYVRELRGQVALMRGPLVYCLEAIDNDGQLNEPLAINQHLHSSWESGLLDNVTTLSAATASGRCLNAIPLYAWDNRAAGAMRVWLPQAGMPDSWDTAGWGNQLYRTYEPER
ncbi:MAG: glycoside hydrolase family 127 protein [Chloroflexi bacterium]|nr:glycoside hydrolase family 127 protein [Chloroflexota bacterium]